MNEDFCVDIRFVCLKLRRPTSLSVLGKKLKETAAVAVAPAVGVKIQTIF